MVRSPCLQPPLRRRRKWLRREALGFGGSDEDTAHEDEQTAPSGLTNTRLQTQVEDGTASMVLRLQGRGRGRAAKGPLARPARTIGEDPPHPVQTAPRCLPARPVPTYPARWLPPPPP